MLGAFLRGCISIPLHCLSRVIVKVWGWKVLGTAPEEPKYILLAAPHTSNWDAIVMLMLACYYRIRVYWMVKHSVFVGPFGWFLKAIGGVPINRRAAHGIVQQMIERFERSERFILLIPPEGTRGKSKYWKSGFYHIALGAKVPVVSGTMDWAKKESGLVDTYKFTGRVQEDMDHLRAIYAHISARYPEDYSPCRIREEDLAPGERRRPPAGPPAEGDSPHPLQILSDAGLPEQQTEP